MMLITIAAEVSQNDREGHFVSDSNCCCPQWYIN